MNIDVLQQLAGLTVVITRAQDQQGQAHILFKEAGAIVLDMPALIIGPPDEWGPLDDALAELDQFHWIIFSSSNGVQAVQERLQRQGRTLANCPNSLKIAAVGRKTAQKIEQLGASIDFVPPDFVADSLIKHFPVSGYGLNMLLPRVQSGGRNILANQFGLAGARVVEVPAYESRCPDSIPEATSQALVDLDVDAIIFTSGKTVAHTAKLLDQCFGVGREKILNGVKILSIGPQTSLSCKKYFSRVDKEATPHDLDGLLNACIQLFSMGN